MFLFLYLMCEVKNYGKVVLGVSNVTLSINFHKKLNPYSMFRQEGLKPKNHLYFFSFFTRWKWNLFEIFTIISNNCLKSMHSSWMYLFCDHNFSPGKSNCDCYSRWNNDKHYQLCKISQNIVKVNLFTLLYSTSLLYLGEQMGSGRLGNKLKIWTDRSICNVFLSTVCMYEERITEWPMVLSSCFFACSVTWREIVRREISWKKSQTK